MRLVTIVLPARTAAESIRLGMRAETAQSTAIQLNGAAIRVSDQCQIAPRRFPPRFDHVTAQRFSVINNGIRVGDREPQPDGGVDALIFRQRIDFDDPVAERCGIMQRSLAMLLLGKGKTQRLIEPDESGNVVSLEDEQSE